MSAQPRSRNRQRSRTRNKTTQNKEKATSKVSNSQHAVQKNDAIRIPRRPSEAARRAALTQFATQLVDPDELKNATLVVPGLGAGRAGSAPFPLIFEIPKNSTNGAFNMIMTPSIHKPIQYSAPSVQPFAAWDIEGRTSGHTVSSKSSMDELEVRFLGGCDTIARIVGGKLCFPLVTDGGTTNLSVKVADDNSKVSYTVIVSQYINDEWAVLDETGFIGGGQSENATMAVTYGSGSSTVTHIALEIGGIVPQPDDAFKQAFGYHISRSGGAHYTCSVDYDPLVMTARQPEWANLSASVERLNVVAMSAMLTYVGEPILGSGRAAGCVADQNMPFSDPYSTIADRPYDRALTKVFDASGKNGGLHIHWIPNDVRQFAGAASPDNPPNSGYFAFTGFNPEAALQVECHFVVNYYSRLPEYNMRLQPPIDGYLAMLYYLRKEIPMVTSNDNHKSKLKKLVRSAVDHLIANPHYLEDLMAML